MTEQPTDEELELIMKHAESGLDRARAAVRHARRNGRLDDLVGRDSLKP